MSKNRILCNPSLLQIAWLCAGLLVLAAGGGCMTPTDPCEGVSCGDGESCVEGECVPPPDPCEGVTCGEGESCDGGECVEIVVGPPQPGIDTDTDGDGLTDEREINGWEIWVDFVGVGASAGEFGGSSAPYVVTSDPLDRDTDDDGVYHGCGISGVLAGVFDRLHGRPRRVDWWALQPIAIGIPGSASAWGEPVALSCVSSM